MLSNNNYTHTRIFRLYLMAELIAGNSQYNKPLLRVFGVELIHLSVVPDRRTSERCHILDQHHFSFKRGEIELVTRQQLG